MSGNLEPESVATFTEIRTGPNAFEILPSKPAKVGYTFGRMNPEALLP